MQQMGCKRWVFARLRRWAIGGAFGMIRTTYIYGEVTVAFRRVALSLIPLGALGTITLLNNLYIIGRVVQKTRGRAAARVFPWPLRASEGNLWERGRMAEETAATEDKRITRSKCALKDALVELIEERGLANFNASDLCSRANLNRGTLYNNFGDKDGLLAALEDDVMRDLEAFQAQMQRLELRDVLRYRVSKKPMPFLVSLFDHLREQGSFLHAVMGPKGDPSFGPRVRDAVCTEIIQTILHERYRNDPAPFVQYYVAFYASAYLGVITHWVETGMKESSQDMAQIALRLFFIKPGDPIKL